MMKGLNQLLLGGVARLCRPRQQNSLLMKECRPLLQLQPRPGQLCVEDLWGMVLGRQSVLQKDG